MGWRNCDNCDAEMDVPSMREQIDGQACPRCGHLHESLDSHSDILGQMLEAIEEVQQRVHEIMYPP